MVSEEELKHSLKFKDYFEIKCKTLNLITINILQRTKNLKDNEYFKTSDQLSLNELTSIIKQEIKRKISKRKF